MNLRRNRSSEGDTSITFRDMTMLALAGFVVIVMILLPHINPRAKKSQDGIVPPGNVIVEITWSPELDTDIDLWVQAPGDVPVGYSNKGGVVFNLLRDDLGRQGDVTEVNYENSFSRGIVPGEYTVNVHLYRHPSGVYPVRVVAVASVKKSANEDTRQLIKTEVNLFSHGEEVTAMRFVLTEEGDLVPGSAHSLFKPLRSAIAPSSASPADERL